MVVVADFAATTEGSANGSEHSYLTANEITCQRWKPIELPLGPPIFNQYVFRLRIQFSASTLLKSGHIFQMRCGRCTMQESCSRNFWMLSAYRNQLRHCRAAKRRNELARASWRLSPSQIKRSNYTISSTAKNGLMYNRKIDGPIDRHGSLATQTRPSKYPRMSAWPETRTLLAVQPMAIQARRERRAPHRRREHGSGSIIQEQQLFRELSYQGTRPGRRIIS